jgi:hypothetical protein
MLTFVATLAATALYLPMTARMPTNYIVMKQGPPSEFDSFPKKVDFSKPTLTVPDTTSAIKKPPSVEKAAAQIKKEKLAPSSSAGDQKMDQVTDAIAKAFVFVSDATSKAKTFADENDLGTKAKELGVGARDTASKLVESSDDIIDQAKAMPTNFVENNFIITARAVLEVLGDEVKASKKEKASKKPTTTKKTTASRSMKRGGKPSPIKSEKKEKKGPFDFF